METIQKIGSLTKSQEELLQIVTDARSVPVSEFADRFEDMRELIAKGCVKLRVVNYPWGLDFELISLSASMKKLEIENKWSELLKQSLKKEKLSVHIREKVVTKDKVES